MGHDALVAFGGTRIVYIGEWRGATGSSSLHDRLESEWNLADCLDIPVWLGRDDRLRVFTRRSR